MISSRLFLLVVLCGISFAMSLEEIKEKPKGVARDFYIWQFLQKNDVDTQMALEIYPLINAKIPKLMDLIKHKIPRDKLPKDMLCKGLAYKELIKKDDECLNIGFRLGFAMDNKIEDSVKSRLKSQKTLEKIKILESKDILNSLLKGSGEQFSEVYFSLPRTKIFDNKIKNLKSLNNKNFNKSIYHLIITQKYPKFAKSLLRANVEGVNDYTFFALGLNELLNGKATKALKYFEQAAAISKIPLLRDSAYFWQYKISGDKRALESLSKSTNFNLYSLYAVRKLGVEPTYEIILRDNAIFAKLNSKPSSFNINDPFVWQQAMGDIGVIKDKENLMKALKPFYHENTLPHFLYILNRYFDYKKKFFVMPYSEAFEKMEGVENDIKYLAYAVAKQESRFLPAVISRSYALGMMQIMPQNVLNFAKEQNLSDITLESMFEPHLALQFGVHYLQYLKKHFNHPLFISYAYNGGPTFFRNFLKNNNIAFKKSNKYNPWLSMELIPYEESRIYGVKVLANYIMYNEINGVELDIDELMESTLS